MPHNNPVNILGAGPSGLTAAILLARAGREVHVHERYDTIGKRFQGDLQGIENWSTQENVLAQFRSFHLDTNFAATPFSEVTLTDGRTVLQETSKEPLFYLVKRGSMSDSLDTALYHQALSCGVQFHMRSSPSTADIIATGPKRKALIAVDKGLIFPTKLPNIAVAFFHDDLAHLGYSYLLVADGYGCLCTVVFKDFHRLNSCFDRTVALAKHMYPLNLDNAQPVGGIGSFSLEHPKQEGSTLYVGEAAGLQDLLWGFGIRTAITSGQLAVQAMLSGQSYPELIHQSIKPQLKSTIVNRFLWEKLKWKSRPILPFLFRVPLDLRNKFRFLYSFSIIHRLIYPLASCYIEKQYKNSVTYTDPFIKEEAYDLQGERRGSITDLQD